MIQLAHALRRRLLALLRWRTRGVKVAAFDPAGRLLLVRHSYGATDLWMLPGGGVGRREMSVHAAARELREETGLALPEPELFARYTSAAEGRRDEIALFTGRVVGTSIIDQRELAAAAFFPLTDLPERTSPATRRRIAELRYGSAISPTW